MVNFFKVLKRVGPKIWQGTEQALGTITKAPLNIAKGIISAPLKLAGGLFGLGGGQQQEAAPQEMQYQQAVSQPQQIQQFQNMYSHQPSGYSYGNIPVNQPSYGPPPQRGSYGPPPSYGGYGPQFY